MGQDPLELQCLRWMPAHTAEGSIGRVTTSDGTMLTALEWRANRLVDALAKSAAVPNRLQGSTRS